MQQKTHICKAFSENEHKMGLICCHLCLQLSKKLIAVPHVAGVHVLNSFVLGADASVGVLHAHRVLLLQSEFSNHEHSCS